MVQVFFLSAVGLLQPVLEMPVMAGQGGLVQVKMGGQGPEGVAGQEGLIDFPALGMAADGTGNGHGWGPP
jgi:hypothetical protein